MIHSELDSQPRPVRYDFLSNPWAARKTLQGFTLADLATSGGIVPAFIAGAGHDVRTPVSTTVTAARVVTVKAPVVAVNPNQTSVVDLREIPESASMARCDRQGSGEMDRPSPARDAVDSPTT